MPTPDGDTTSLLLAALGEVHDRIGRLDPGFNAHRVARYELNAALRELKAFAADGDPATLAFTEERFRRMFVMLTLPDRRLMALEVNRVVEAAAALSPDERHALAVANWVDHNGSGASDDVSASTNTVIGDEIEFIRQVMTGLASGLERWTWEVPSETRTRTGRQWHIDNEIHVQNLLWLALAPSLPDLKREETLPSIAGLSPRADLALPRLHLAIEAKFIRRSSDYRRVREEILADTGLYTSAHDSPYSRLMVLVWDDTRSTERHRRLENDLKTLRGVVDAVVVSRPGTMT